MGEFRHDNGRIGVTFGCPARLFGKTGGIHTSSEEENERQRKKAQSHGKEGKNTGRTEYQNSRKFTTPIFPVLWIF